MNKKQPSEQTNRLKMPEPARQRVLQSVLSEFDRRQEKSPRQAAHSHRGRRFACALVCACLIAVSGFSVLAAYPSLPGKLVSSLRSLFTPRQQAINDVYGEKADDIARYTDSLKTAREQCSFADDVFQVKMVSCMGDKGGMQILLEYVAGESLRDSVPQADTYWVLDEAGNGYATYDQVLASNGHRGYWLFYTTAPENGHYTLSLENVYWNGSLYTGLYQIDFQISPDAETVRNEVNRIMHPTCKTVWTDTMTVNTIALSPLALTVHVTMPENCSPNEIFGEILNPQNKLSANDLSLGYSDGTQAVPKGTATLSLWETNGRFDDSGSALTAENATATLVILFDKPISLEHISSLMLLGDDIPLQIK